MPNAWVAFLMAAETYFRMFGSVEGAVRALKAGSTPEERVAIQQFLDKMASLDEKQCRAASHDANEVVDVNIFKLARCRLFYQTARDAFRE